jgi:cytochrome c2
MATANTTRTKLRQGTADDNKKVLLTFPFDSVAASASIVAHMKVALILPILSISTIPLHAEQVNMVELGDKTFHLWGCSECHVSTKNDNSIKTGPSLYNLFTTTPREIEVLAGEGGKKTTVKADREYFLQSVRKPAEQLTISESGPTKGTAYGAIMPQFTVETVTDSDLEAIWHYLRHAADEPNAGPAAVMAEIQAKAPPKNILENPAEIVVSKRPRVYRAPLLQSSGRAIHVGLPNGMNYTFDPRMLSVRKVWSGGFLNMEKEQKNGILEKFHM